MVNLNVFKSKLNSVLKMNWILKMMKVMSYHIIHRENTYMAHWITDIIRFCIIAGGMPNIVKLDTLDFLTVCINDTRCRHKHFMICGSARLMSGRLTPGQILFLLPVLSLSLTKEYESESDMSFISSTNCKSAC